MATKTKVNHANAVEHAEKVVANLQAKYDAVAAARADDDRAMGEVSYRAHADNDPTANAKLDAIGERAWRRDIELKSISTAIAVAQQNLAEAKQAESQTQARKAAREILRRANAIVKYAQTLDDANAVKVEASRAIADELTQMRALAHRAGLYVPSHEQFLALGSRADQPAHMATPFPRAFCEH